MRTLRKQFSLVLLCFSFLNAAFAQPIGKVIEQKSIKSTIMGKEVNYSIYLPYDYAQSERSYPVVYLLHDWRQSILCSSIDIGTTLLEQFDLIKISSGSRCV